jgi:hypothetical protein
LNSVTETQAAWALLEGLPADFKEFVSTVKAVHAGANSNLPLRTVRKMILVKAKDVMKLQDSNPPMGLTALLPNQQLLDRRPQQQPATHTRAEKK